MSFSTVINKVQYDGNDATTVFSFPYLFQANGDLTVIRTDSEGVDTTLVLDTNYSVSGAENPAGGSVTYPTSGEPLETGEKITIIREMDMDQETDLSNHGAYFLAAIEAAMDKMMMSAQQLQEMYDRCVKVDITDTDSPPSVTDYNTALETVQALEAAFDNLVVQNHSAVSGVAQTDFTMPGAWPDLDATSNVTVYDNGLKIDRDDYTVTAPDQVVFDVGRTIGHTIIFELHEALSSDDLDSALRNHQHVNLIDNGDCRVKRGDNYTLVKDVYGDTPVAGFSGMATGTAVSAGTLEQALASVMSRSGFSIYFNGVTLTGTGIIWLRHRINSQDAKQLKNQKASFSCRVKHTVGLNIDYTVYIRKANSLDDFGAVTEISNSGAQSVISGRNTLLSYENISMGDCSNGVEIEIKVEAGAITTKYFEFAELQFEINEFATAFNRAAFRLDEKRTDINPAFRAVKTSNQVVVTGAYVKVTWNSTDFDTNKDFSVADDRYQPKIAGKYALKSSVEFNNPTDQDLLEIMLRDKSGNAVDWDRQHAAKTGSTVTRRFCTEVDADGSTDYYEVYAKHNHGSDLTLIGNLFTPTFSGFKVA